MASASVTLRKRADPAVWVQAELSLRIASITRVESRLNEAPQRLYLPDGSAHPSYAPAEATLYSGALYALRRLNAIHGPGSESDPRYVVTVDRLAGTYRPEEVEGFALAGLVGVAQMAARPDLVTEDKVADWELEECILSG